MGQNEIVIFIVLVTVVLLIFVGGIIVFVLAYQKQKLLQHQQNQLLEQKHARELIETSLEAQQQTMRDIGREIHDNVGQKLTLSSLYLHKVIHLQGNNTLGYELLFEAAKILNESLQDLRLLSKSLTNPAVAQFSLTELLIQEAQRIKKLNLCEVDVWVVPLHPEISSQQKNTLYRIIQEFVQNSLKHSHCQRINIEIMQKKNTLHLALTDDGHGYDPGAVSIGLGLSNMKRRASELNAQEFSILSEIGKGTKLTFWFDLD